MNVERITFTDQQNQRIDEMILQTIRERDREWVSARNDQLQARTDELNSMRNENAALRNQMTEVLRRMEELTAQREANSTRSTITRDERVEEQATTGSQLSPVSNSEEEEAQSEEIEDEGEDVDGSEDEDDEEYEEDTSSHPVTKRKVSVACQSTPPSCKPQPNNQPSSIWLSRDNINREFCFDGGYAQEELSTDDLQWQGHNLCP